MGRVFSVALSPIEFILLFQYTVFQPYSSIKPPNSTWGGGEIDICVHGLFYTKLNSYNFYLKLFFMGCVFSASAFYVHMGTYIVVVTKKPSMCQIMCFSLYCINGSIEGRRIDYKNFNNTFLAMKSELYA